MDGKLALSRKVEAGEIDKVVQEICECALQFRTELRVAGLISMRLYAQTIEENVYAFLFFAVDELTADGTTPLKRLLNRAPFFSGWEEARHVYEFKTHPGDSYDNLLTQGIIIGVREGMLDEYIQLHDEQPQIIHDLCYQNGFRKSSIFVVDLHRQYLLQFQEFLGTENPELYENDTYRNWLKITGKCQDPLPGEKFWKPMSLIWEF